MAERQLLEELIEKIQTHLDIKNDVHVKQFRAVCQSWQSSIPKPLKPLPQVPQFPQSFLFNRRTSRSFYREFSHVHTSIGSVVYHIAPTHRTAAGERERGWLIRVSRNNQGQPSLLPALLPPLSRLSNYSDLCMMKWQKLDRSFYSFRPKAINLMEFGVFELGQHYLLTCKFDQSFSKLVVSTDLGFPAVMSVRDGTLYLGTLGGPKYCIMIPVKNKNEVFDVVIFYQGNFCAVSKYGKALVLDSSTKYRTEIASPISSSRDKKKKKKKKKKNNKKNYLVESLGQVLLVERHGSSFVGKGGSIDNMLKTGVKFKVYKLDEIRKQWIEMEALDLNDRILFVGEDSCFALSTQDFPGCLGSCIYFCFEYDEWGCGITSGIGVFILDSGRGYHLEYLPRSANIFMPPPAVSYSEAVFSRPTSYYHFC